MQFLKGNNLIIRHNNNFKVRWDLVIMFLSLYNCFMVPVDMAFKPDFLNSTLMLSINFSIDIIFFFDILISFRSTFVNKKGEEESDSVEMALHYMKGYFIFDFLATVPFDSILSNI